MGPSSPSSSGSRQTLGPGVKIGEYVLEDFLGKGGFGEVWGAQHPAIGKQVAIKVLSANALVNYETLARFKREARAVNEIGHENLVDIFSFGETPDGRPYYVMELLRGESLAEYIKRKGPPPFSLILEIFRQVCNALQAAHQKNIIHRDLKPDNIFLDKKKSPELSVKLLDFGIAKLAGNDEEGGISLTRTGIPFGTPAYMSPEQCDGAKTLDHRADIYSLGIVLYELLTGRNPFREESDSALDLLMKHKKNEAQPPSRLAPQRGIPKEVDALVLKSLAKKPDARFDSAIALYEELKKHLPKDGGAAQQKSELSFAPTMAATQPPAPTKKNNLIVGISFVAVLLLASGVWALWPETKTTQRVIAPQSQSIPVKPKANNWKLRASSLPTASTPIIASSSKADNSVERAIDKKANTAWCEGVAGDGLGEWLALYLATPSRAGAMLRVNAKSSKNTNTPTSLRVDFFAAEKKLGQQDVKCRDAVCEAPLAIAGADAVRLIITQTDEPKSRNVCISEVTIE